MYLLVFMLVLLLLLLLLLPLLFLLPNCAYTPFAKTCPKFCSLPPLPELPRVQGVRNLKPCHVEPQIELRKIRKLKRIATGTTDVLVHAVRYQN